MRSPRCSRPRRKHCAVSQSDSRGVVSAPSEPSTATPRCTTTWLSRWCRRTELPAVHPPARGARALTSRNQLLGNGTRISMSSRVSRSTRLASGCCAAAAHLIRSSTGRALPFRPASASSHPPLEGESIHQADVSGVPWGGGVRSSPAPFSRDAPLLLPSPLPQAQGSLLAASNPLPLGGVHERLARPSRGHVQGVYTSAVAKDSTP